MRARFVPAHDELAFPTASIGADGRLRAANRAFLARFVDAGADPAGLLLPDRIQPADRDSFLGQIAAVIAAPDVPREAELRINDAAEQTLWARMGFAQGIVDGMAVVTVQILPIAYPTQVIEMLSERESRWNHAMTSSGFGLWDHNYRLDTMYYSDKWKLIRGIPADAEVDPDLERWLEHVHPEDRAGISDAIARQNNGEENEIFYRYRERHRGHGRWIWIECRGACVEWGPDGRPTRVIGVDIDVTENRQNEETIANISRRLELALGVSEIGTFEADTAARTVHWDDTMLRLYGVPGTPREKPFGYWEKFVHPDDLQAAVGQIETGRALNRAFTSDYRILHPAGDIRTIRVRAAPYTDSEGREKVIGVNWDVTADVTMRTELAEAKRIVELRNQALEAARASIEHNALHDYLTGLPNRRYLDQVLDEEQQRCREEGTSLAILHIDLDRFKQINDTLGHGAGDWMLKHAADVLRENVHGTAFVARIGGDEFVYVARFTGSARKFSVIADRMIRDLCKPVSYEGHPVRFGASIGIAVSDDSEVEARQLLLNADIALYRAKSQGRNRYQFFSREIQSLLINQKRIADDILIALEQDQFVPFYQPQFDAKTLAVTGMETLVRWQHPREGLKTPDTFLAVADDLDAVSRIDGVVLEKALADYRRWTEDGFAIPRISVNVSSRRLSDPQLVRKLKSLRILPGTVSFELLESTFLDHYDEEVRATLESLRQLGIGIEIDDFGTGHASIVSLMKLGPDILKIDRELIRHIPVSPEQRRLVGSIIEIGKSLNIAVLAEGVETADHVRILRALGCDLLQGYGLARPMPAADIPAFLTARPWLAIDGQA